MQSCLDTPMFTGQIHVQTYMHACMNASGSSFATLCFRLTQELR